MMLKRHWRGLCVIAVLCSAWIVCVVIWLGSHEAQFTAMTAKAVLMKPGMTEAEVIGIIEHSPDRVDTLSGSDLRIETWSSHGVEFRAIFRTKDNSTKLLDAACRRHPL